jgi:hypothetical protein
MINNHNFRTGLYQ